MRRPVILLALSLPAGIVLGQTFLYFPWSALALFFLACAVSVVLLKRGQLSAVALLLVLSGIASGMVLLVVDAGRVPPDDYRRWQPFDGAVHRITGRISSPLDRDPGRIAFTVAVDRIDDRKASGTVRVTVRGDSIPVGYGDRVELSGRVFPPRGTRNPGGFDYPAYLARHGVHAVLALKSAADVRIIERGSGVLRAIQNLRDRIRQTMLASLSGDGAAVLLAMTIGEEDLLTDDLRDRFMAAGVTHIISISGSHLGMIAVICFWIVRNGLFLLPERLYHRLTLRIDPRKAAALAAVLPVVFYAFLAGGQIATLRALIMILAGLAAVLLDREGDLLSALALAALVTLLPDPQALFDISFQLSYLSVLSIGWAVTTVNALLPPAPSLQAQVFRGALLLSTVSLAAALVTGPLVAYYFQQISIAGFIANMVVVPFAGAVVVPLGLFGGILSLDLGYLPFAAVTRLAADAFVAIVGFFAELPFAAVHLSPPGPLFVLAYTGLLSASALLLRSRLFARLRPLETFSRAPRWAGPVAVVSAALLVLSLFSPLVATRHARATFVDVGQGDSSLVETADGRNILIDGGGVRDNRFDVGRRVLAPFLRDRNIGTIDLLVLSHPHPDHMNGLFAVLKDFKVNEAWVSGLDRGLPGYAEFEALAGSKSVPVRTVSAGDRMDLGGAQVEVLHPGPSFRQRKTKEYAAENDRSLVLRISVGGTAMLFPGDLHGDGERELLRTHPLLTADVLKVPHHGSRTSSAAALVGTLRPRLAVIPVGDGNPYRHPSDEVVERYEAAGTRVYRTDRNGAVTVHFGKDGMNVQPWTELLLRRIVLDDRAAWWAMERENGRRLWIRTRGI